ncbi:AMP-binding protein [Nocardioides kongjuensis]|uniref:Crotonobetaine/carnitine-CoA ligase n=1 Tax=Nocardioides kongjuensis TaxID=349522 RepID=A0A852RP75_9ACTN|nr:crotonobetaine/carnitine-CoA ligase [Nocardioides kongjuensis]
MATPRSLAEAVRIRAEANPDGELVRVAGGTSDAAMRTAAGLYEHAEILARGLARWIGPGAAVTTAVEPGTATIALSTALSILGAVEVALPAGTDRVDAHRLATATDSAATLVAPARLAAQPWLADLPARTRLGTAPTTALEQLDPHPLPHHRPQLETPAVVMLTSGTTGRTKGALLPNGAGLGQARRVQRAMAYTPEDALLSFFPWQHVNARHAAFLPAVISGARLVVWPRFSASRFWQTAAAEGVTAFNFMGAVCAMLLRQPPGPHDRGHLVRRAYGGPAPAEMVHAMAERYGVRLRQAYACTELGDVATTGAEIRPGAAGRPVPEYDVEVRAGELVVRPRVPALTAIEYVGDPEATATAWRDGWFHTGDQARLDDGWLVVEGRSADVIRRRGISIGASRIEDAVAQFGGVAEVAAIGVESELTEDEVLVVVVPTTEGLTPAAIHAHCRDVLPRHAVPRFISIEPTLPRNQSLKVLRRILRERGLPPDAWDAERPAPHQQESP